MFFALRYISEFKSGAAGYTKSRGWDEEFDGLSLDGLVGSCSYFFELNLSVATLDLI